MIGNDDIFNYLISKNVNVNLGNNMNITPLSYTIQYQLTNFKDILIYHKANVNCYLETGETPLHYAINNNNNELFIKLIEQCADVNSFDNNYDTPLISSLNSDNKFYINTLLKNGSNQDNIKRKHLDKIDEPYKSIFLLEILKKKETFR